MQALFSIFLNIFPFMLIMSLNDLLRRISIANVNLFMPQTSKVIAIRSSAPETICEAPDCRQEDILEF